MFEQPIVQVGVADGHAERVEGGGLVAFALSLSRDGRRLAYKNVLPRSMGDVTVLDLITHRSSTLTDVNPGTLRDARPSAS
ncbi:MAG: hypothetical protein U0Q12_02845 [Vicinamibacterales bacterium]